MSCVEWEKAEDRYVTQQNFQGNKYWSIWDDRNTDKIITYCPFCGSKLDDKHGCTNEN